MGLLEAAPYWADGDYLYIHVYMCISLGVGAGLDVQRDVPECSGLNGSGCSAGLAASRATEGLLVMIYNKDARKAVERTSAPRL